MYERRDNKLFSGAMQHIFSGGAIYFVQHYTSLYYYSECSYLLAYLGYFYLHLCDLTHFPSQPSQ
jgi:hypothetical protein